MGIAILGERIIDGTGRPPFAGMIVMEGDRIAYAGAQKEIGDIETIRAGSDTVLPGLIDSHVHLEWYPRTATDLAWFRRHPRIQLGEFYSRYEFVDAKHQDAILATVNLREDLKSGVTTVRNVSARDFLGLALKQAIETGILQGPRLFFGGIGLRVTHGHGNNAQAFDGPVALVAAVRRNLLAGVDLIKIYVSGSATDPHTKLADSCMSREEIAAVVEQSHKAKRFVSAHCHGGQGLIDCLELGVDTIEHGMAMTEEDVDRMCQTRSFLVVTPINYPFELEQRKHMPAVLAQMSKVKDKFPEILRKAAAKGIRIAIGTDGRHGLMPDALIRMVEYGFSPMDVIVASTKRGGEVCNVPQDLGSLEPGKLADLLIVKGDPLQDIRAIQDIRCVIKGGQVVKRTELN